MSRRAMGPLLAAMATMWVHGRVEAQTPPRAVAVIDATAGTTSDPDVATLAALLDAQLDKEDDLAAVASDRRPALVGGVQDEISGALAEASSALTRARDARARFDDKDAVTEAARGLEQAVSLPPSEDVVALIAELAFVRALAEADHNATAATRDFALVRRLDPGRTLDPVKYVPEVITLFDKAGKAGAQAALDIAAPAGGEVWVDGASVGEAPAVVTLAAGLHVVTVTGALLVTRGEVVEVSAKGTAVTIDAAEASGTVIVHRLRRRLADAPDDLARAEAIAAILRAVGGQDAIVVGRDAAQAVVTWTYSGKSGALGEPKAAEGRKAEDIVKPLRPIKAKIVPPPGGGGPEVPPPPTVPWYKRRWVQVTIGGTVVAAVLTSAIVAVTQPTGTSMLRGVEFGSADEGHQ